MDNNVQRSRSVSYQPAYQVMASKDALLLDTGTHYSHMIFAPEEMDVKGLFLGRAIEIR